MIALSGTPDEARADPPPPPWQGVWAGQIGTLPVRACLRHENWGTGGGYSRAFYYYLSQGKIITLAQRGDSTLWVEDGERSKEAGEPGWTFEHVTVAALDGVWRNKGKALPFRLKRVTGTDAETGCDSDEFNLPRVKPFRITSKPAAKDGVPYTRLFYNPGPQFDIAVETFVLPETLPGARAVNAQLRKTLPPPTGTNDYLECEFSGLTSGSAGGNYDLTVAPVMITRRWLATQTNEGTYCGGAHPNSGTSSQLYDRNIGKMVDPIDWFATTAFKTERVGASVVRSVTPAFRTFLLAQKPAPDGECLPSLREAGYWDIGLSRAGMAVTPQLAHVDAGCENPIMIPYARLTHWLNPAGKNAVASVVSDIATR